MKLFLVYAGLGERRRFAGSFAAFLVLAGLFLWQAPRAAAQSQSLAVNRALVSSGPPASPPTAPPRPLGGVQPPYIPAVALLLGIVGGAAPPLKIPSNKQGSFALVGVRPDQLVQVSVQYPVIKTGHRIVAEALDGGQILVEGPMVVGLDSTIRFQFRAAHMTGINHIALHDGAQELGIQFWVLDESHPERNPPVVNL